jgi:hypothetical protein
MVHYGVIGCSEYLTLEWNESVFMMGWRWTLNTSTSRIYGLVFEPETSRVQVSNANDWNNLLYLFKWKTFSPSCLSYLWCQHSKLKRRTYLALYFKRFWFHYMVAFCQCVEASMHSCVLQTVKTELSKIRWRW